jgi:hypothetical protein
MWDSNQPKADPGEIKSDINHDNASRPNEARAYSNTIDPIVALRYAKMARVRDDDAGGGRIPAGGGHPAIVQAARLSISAI